MSHSQAKRSSIMLSARFPKSLAQQIEEAAAMLGCPKSEILVEGAVSEMQRRLKEATKTDLESVSIN